jgi:hypothetical protein
MTTFINDEFNVAFNTVRRMLSDMPDLDDAGEQEQQP